MFLLQSAEATRPTFWRIGPVGKAAFYYLAAVALVAFTQAVAERSAPSP